MGKDGGNPDGPRRREVTNVLCVIAKLDEDANERLASLRAAVFPGISALPPLYGHITMATYLPEDHKAFIKGCGEVLDAFPAFTVRYERIGFFTVSGVIFAQPSESPTLSAIHRRIAEKYGQDLDQWTGGADWFPHTTLLSVPLADPDDACRAMQRLFVPFETRICRVEFSLVGDTGFTVLGGADLK